MPAPYFNDLTGLERLKGEPRVSYPDGDLAYPVTERIFERVKGDETRSYYSPEPDAAAFPHNVLVAQSIISRDRNRCNVAYRYQVLPSKRKWSQSGWNEVIRGQMYRAVWTDRATASPPAVGGRIAVQCGGISISNAVVVDSGFVTIDSVTSQPFVVACAMPRARVEWQDRAYQFPGIFRYLRGWLVGQSWPLPPPWLGYNYTLTSPRTSTVVAKVEISFSIGPTNALPQIFEVSTQAAASRLFPGITANTVHQAFTIPQFNSVGATAPAESFAASSPATYSDTQTLIIEATEEPVLGNIWMKKIVKVRERGLPR